jgi:hypothetical protein
MALNPFETAEGSAYPTVEQISVFLENRVGQLLRLAKLFERTDIHILALSIVNAIDCAVVRLIVNNPDLATEVLQLEEFAVSHGELLCVLLPPGKRGLLDIYSALVGAEIDVRYTYPLIVHPHGRAAVVIQADNLEMAAATLRHHKIEVLDQSDLQG